jgi:hypothetical protein
LTGNVNSLDANGHVPTSHAHRDKHCRNASGYAAVSMMMISLHGRNGVALAVPQPKEIGSEDVATRFEPLTAVHK